MIPQVDCKERGIYRTKSRNLDVAVYDGQGGFIGIRTKFDRRYLFTEYHADTGAPFGTVHPYEEIGMLPEGVDMVEYYRVVDGIKENKVLFDILDAIQDAEWTLDTGAYL